MSLLVTPAQAEKVTLATELGSIKLVMRGPEEEAEVHTEGAVPHQLFGGSDKAERDREEAPPQAGLANLKEQGKGFLEYLNALREKANVEKPAPAEPAEETWSVRVFGRIGRRRHYLAKSRPTPPPDAGYWTLSGWNRAGRKAARPGRKSRPRRRPKRRSPPGREAVRATAAWAAAATRAASPAANYRPVWRGRRRNKRIHEDNGSREEEQGCSC